MVSGYKAGSDKPCMQCINVLTTIYKSWIMGYTGTLQYSVVKFRLFDWGFLGGGV